MTCENYNCNDAIAVEKEQERKLTVHDKAHVNYDIAKSDKNVILEHDRRIDDYKNFRAYVKDYKEEHGISGRFNIDTSSDRNATKVLSCFVMSASRDLISSMTRTEQIEYFRTGLEFLKQEYPSFHVVDSRIHFDEQGLPHMHTSMLPIHEKENGDRVFNVSQHQKGKDYFRGFQDRFYDYMKERYPEKDLQRTDPNRDHDKKLTVKEYKDNQDLKHELEQERQILLERAERLQEIEQEIDRRFDEADEIERYNQSVDKYCKEHGMSYLQYEKQCYWAERGVGEYPAPELENQERQLEHDVEIEIDRER